MNNFGVELLLQRFLQLAPPPAPRRSGDATVAPDAAGFSGFVFKIQANMDPKHRDHVAFVRIVSGVFRRDMTVTHARSGKRLRLANSKRLFARERETIEEGLRRRHRRISGQLRSAHRRHARGRPEC
jgi:peptide chain release factor 3